ncbi:MAG: transglutaminase-like domain-containing protein [Microgenomates group bacterium]
MVKVQIPKLLRFLLACFLLVFCFIFYASSVKAADFKSDYQVEYFLTENKDNLSSNVNFKITITNLRSDVYVSKFTISSPKSFVIHNLKAYDDKGEITPVIENEETRTKITLQFTSPSTGKGSVNNFYLKFDQENLFKINGNIWEVILPTMERKEEGTYKVIVNLPEKTTKKISLAKPKPDKITGQQIIWENPKTKTIYAVFGDRQYYQTELTFNLKNPKIVPVVTEVAFPPDTLYQKIYIEKINPPPEKVFIDEDGNFLGQYLLGPNVIKKVVFTGTIEVLVNPRLEVLPVIQKQFTDQKKYLLTAQKYWQIDNLERFNFLTTAQDIYTYVTNNLKYNYKRVTKGNERLGALKILKNPDQAVCTEFTDFFIALAREKGIWAREIEGYGFSSDPNLRPLSLISDVLHAWPEYYDVSKNIWIPVDPTWENTSGIDYFSSFDLNHIVFAIHGKRSDYPLPAGMYKTEDSKDIKINVTNIKPLEKNNLKTNINNLPSLITEGEEIKGKIFIKNLGNVYFWQIPVKLWGQKIEVVPKELIVPVLAPGEQREINFNLKAAHLNQISQGLLKINIYGKDIRTFSFSIYPYTYQLTVKITLVIIFIFLIITLLKKILKSLLPTHDR